MCTFVSSGCYLSPLCYFQWTVISSLVFGHVLHAGFPSDPGETGGISKTVSVIMWKNAHACECVCNLMVMVVVVDQMSAVH